METRTKSESQQKENLSEDYKKTKVGLIPKDWIIRTIDEVTTNVGDGIHSTPVYDTSGEYYFVNGNNIFNGKLKITRDTSTVSESEYYRHRKALNANSLLLSINGTIGNIAYYRGENILLGKSAAFLNLKENVSKEYLFYQLQTKFVQEFFYNNLTGTTIKNLGLYTIRATPIALPPNKSEQTAIATALSDVDNLIASLDKLITKKKAIKQATMQQLLTQKDHWQTKLLGEVAEIQMGQSPRSGFYNTEGLGIPLLQGNADFYNRKSLIRSYTTEITKRCKKGDIIMTVRAPVGKVGKATFEACLGRGVCTLRYNNDFLYYYLIFNESYWISYSTGSTFDSIDSSAIRNLEIVLPPLKEQEHIVSVLSDIDNEIEALEKRKAKKQQIKEGMMQELLTGKTRLI